MSTDPSQVYSAWLGSGGMMALVAASPGASPSRHRSGTTTPNGRPSSCRSPVRASGAASGSRHYKRVDAFPLTRKQCEVVTLSPTFWRLSPHRAPVRCALRRADGWLGGADRAVQTSNSPFARPKRRPRLPTLPTPCKFFIGLAQGVNACRRLRTGGTRPNLVHWTGSQTGHRSLVSS